MHQTLVNIVDLQPGMVVRIAGYYPGPRDYRRKLLSMGLTPNTLIEIIRRAPLGDPIHIKVRQYDLTLRQAEASILKLILQEVS